MEDRPRPYSIFWPLLLIAVGLFLLLNTLGFVEGDFWSVALRLWPLLFIVGGLDSLYRQESYVGPILFIGLGTVLLLGNLGYLELVPWTVFLRLWPVLLIAFGLDIVIGRRSVWSAAAGVLLGLALVAGVIWYASTLPEVQAGYRTETVSQELGTAQRGRVEINQIFGELNIQGGASAGSLVTGELQLSRDQEVNQDYSVQNGEAVFTIDSSQQTVTPFMNPAASIVWGFNLADGTPLVLDTNLIVGVQDLDLSSVDLTELNAETVIGQNTIQLPADSDFEGEASVVIGQLVIRVPRDLPVRINLDTGIVGTSFPDGFERDGDIVYSTSAGLEGQAVELRVNVPIGSVRIEYAR